MELSNTTDKTGILQDIERWCGMADGNITGNTALKKRFINDVNENKFDIESLILTSQDEFDYDDSNHTDFPIVTTPLTTNRDYQLTASERILKIKRVDVTYDGTNYYRATPFDSAEYEDGMGNATNTDKNFSTSHPHYDVKYGSLFLYPIATAAQVAAGAEMQIEWTREGVSFATDGTDDTVEPGFDRSFHSLLSKKTAFDWLIVNKPRNTTLISRLEKAIERQELQLMTHYGRKHQDRDYQFNSSQYIQDFS